MSHALYLAHPKTEPQPTSPASTCRRVRRPRPCLIQACSVTSSPEGRWLAGRPHELAVALPRPAHPLHVTPEAPLI